MTDILSFKGEIVLTERTVTNEFKILDIHESIVNKFVNVEVELGPFIEEDRPNGEKFKRGSSRRGLTLWQNDEYLSIADTWDNTAMIKKITELLAAQATPTVTAQTTPTV